MKGYFFLLSTTIRSCFQQPRMDVLPFSVLKNKAGPGDGEIAHTNY